MKISLLVLSLLQVTSFAFASEPATKYVPNLEGCGEFDIVGVIGFDAGDLVLKVHSGSLSQIRFSLPAQSQMRALPFVDKTVLVRGVISQKIEKFRGSIDIKSIKQEVPDPLASNGSAGFASIKPQACMSK